MRRIFTSVLSFSFIAMGVVAHAQKIQRTNIAGDFPKKSAQELAKSNGFDRCSFIDYEDYLRRKDPKRMTTDQFEAWIAPLIEKAKREGLTSKSTNGGIITIPVVVHVIHNGEAYGTGANITDEQVQSQITVMNQDYRRMAGTRGYNTNAVGADTMIQFALAKVDMNGNPTNGIDRVNLCSTSWSQDNIDEYVKPTTIWNPTQYMNMWSVRFSNNTLLGYAQFPSASGLPGLDANGGDASTDGVVANYATFGSTDFGSFPMTSTYDKGRTMTHEVGHFLGLRHIWGDDSDATVCATDYCNDTPPAHEDNYSCSTPIASCTAGLFEMVENYMDYTNDTCMNIFTQNQKDRMTAVMNNSPRRMELKTSTKDVAIPLFANDGELKAERVCTSNTTCGGTAAIPFLFSLYNRGTSPLTAAVISYTVNGGATQTYNWTGNLVQDKYAIVSISAPGNSVISAQITSVNGTTDARLSNNAATSIAGTYATTPVANTTVNFTLQPDFYGTETTWTLTNSAGNVVKSGGPYLNGVQVGGQIQSLPALVTETWNLTPDCYVFTINDSYGDGIALYGYYNLKNSAGNIIFAEGSTNFGSTQSKSFKVLVLGTKEENFVKQNSIQIYPNPASDVLNVTKVSAKAKFEIHNAVGQLVKSGDINNNQVRVADLVKGTYIITVKDINLSESIKFIKK
ncbi:MAG: M43 family zinc metalloprotease [Candidatus Chryseobacterium colombiense]|nr:M43 family zinc metalloprotease [Chryseobacterium sp.]WEK68371.1 MAG: M43 family zinc metalloprotease [Chryseobacterium sp.]